MDDKEYLRLAVEQARKSVAQGGFPAGAIVVKDGEIIAEGVSIGSKLNDPTGHSETSAIRAACQKLGTTHLDGAVLYASLQPCLMCFSTANWAGISKIIYGCRKNDGMIIKNYYEGKTDIEIINTQNNRQINLVFVPDFENEMLEIIKDWENRS